MRLLILIIIFILLTACSPQPEQPSTETIPLQEPTTPKPECTSNPDCEAFQQCKNNRCIDLICTDCQFIDNHECKDYECCSNDDCEPLQHCKLNKCANLACAKCFFIKNRTCIKFPCCTTTDCDDGNNLTIDKCLKAGTQDATCFHDLLPTQITITKKIPISIPMSRIRTTI